MSRPVFLWWAHRELWDGIAKHPKSVVNSGICDYTISFMARYPGKLTINDEPPNGSFACLAFSKYERDNPDATCDEHCPLDWRIDGIEHNDCIADSKSLGDRFYEALKRKDLFAISEIAKQIRDRPLNKGAHMFYDIIKTEPEQIRRVKVGKPVFFWYLHKKFWDILATRPELNKAEAMRVLKDECHLCVGIIVSDCFACHAQYEYGRTAEIYSDTCEFTVHDTSPTELQYCETHLCPLDWGVIHGYPSFGCVWCNGIYNRWYKAASLEEKAALAAKIRDLTLNENARELYDVKENPDD